MKYSISYNTDIKLRKQADEVRVPLNKLGYLYDFIKENPDKRYVIILNTSYSFDNLNKQLNYIKAVVGDNYTIECDQIYELHQLNEHGYNCYFKFAVADWESFDNLLANNVTDIYIDGPIGFDMDTLKKVKEKYNINIRVRPNSSANAFFAMSINNAVRANSFFIRPEDMYLYEEYIDIIAFDKEDSTLKEEVLFKVYKQKQYTSNISELVHWITPDIKNPSIHPEFGENRINCKQKCKSGGRCRFCLSSFDLAKNLYN